MSQMLRLDLIRACSITVLVQLALGGKILANSIQWDVIESETPRNNINQANWIKSPPPHNCHLLIKLTLFGPKSMKQ